MIRWTLGMAAALAAALLLSACETTPPPAPAQADVSFAHMQPIRLDVARVEVRNTYEPKIGGGHVEMEAPLPPAEALRLWTAQRLEAVGTTGAARVTIEEASLVREELPVEEGLTGLFRHEPSERYTGVISLRLEILDERGFGAAQVAAEARRSRTILENATVREREDALYELTAAMALDLDRKLDELIREHFGRWTR